MHRTSRFTHHAFPLSIRFHPWLKCSVHASPFTHHSKCAMLVLAGADSKQVSICGDMNPFWIFLLLISLTLASALPAPNESNPGRGVSSGIFFVATNGNDSWS